MHKRKLQLLFGFILISLAAYTAWASTRQSMFDWGGLENPPDNLWTIATLIDAYYGFLTFYLWVLWKETRGLPRPVVHRDHGARQHRHVRLCAATTGTPPGRRLHGHSALGAQHLTSRCANSCNDD